MPEAEDGIPRVAPFIVDVPPSAEAPPVTGTLVLHIGNLSASFPVTKDQTVIGRPDSDDPVLSRTWRSSWTMPSPAGMPRSAATTAAISWWTR